MKTLQQIFDKLEENDISIYEYKENKILCGYELNTYTNGGVNQLVFIDFRDTELDSKNPNHFLKLFKNRVNDIDIDDEIEVNRQNNNYKNTFSISESVEDFTDWKIKLQSIFSTKKESRQRQFEQVKDKLESAVSNIEDILELMPVKGNSSNDCQRTHLQQLINEFSHGVNGIEIKDFKPNEYSGDYKLSYS